MGIVPKCIVTLLKKFLCTWQVQKHLFCYVFMFCNVQHEFLYNQYVSVSTISKDEYYLGWFLFAFIHSLFILPYVSTPDFRDLQCSKQLFKVLVDHSALSTPVDVFSAQWSFSAPRRTVKCCMSPVRITAMSMARKLLRRCFWNFQPLFQTSSKQASIIVFV